jgi:hypothetical protein
VLAGGFVRVTTSGLIQVDLDGGGNNWVTLSTINAATSVDVRYLSGGALATLTVSAVAGGATAQAEMVQSVFDSHAMEPLAWRAEPVDLF